MPSSPSPPEISSQTTTTSPPSSIAAQAQLIHTVSLISVVLCPVILALPPRKLDVYSILLVSGTFVGGNQLAREYTGRSIVQRVQEIPARWPSSGKAENVIRKETPWLGTDGAQLKTTNPLPIERNKHGILDELQKQKAATGTSQKPEWKQERDKREIEAAEEGKGYGDLITEQIWEVWNWGRGQAEELKEKDEEVVREAKDHEREKKQ
ncbi:hypothetical protein GLAREA_06601 [Glarea lozoyensis ATCC 20868]|uniref:Uncharacterized protein n=1 Tax=Glarea lozoyensis (strain ATCC 20868 / MF5171) TaxID=1116229 RepID=S3E5A0_GLAL2|nr:uncharacterized protein GLAREA_06601 [Glarea lozoyensis ATCC 20868]EPE33588.1 hypothetical protein GLAREA_06601 [Glarea lozoyensis ATCC 20868]